MERSSPEVKDETSKELIVVGRITRPKGLRGELRVLPDVDDVALFSPGLSLYLTAAGRPPELFAIEHVEIRSKLVVLKFQGIDTIEDAERYRGSLLYAREETLPELPVDSFYYYELVDCQVVLSDESPLGVVKEIRPGAAGDLVVVRTEEREVLIPAAAEFIKEIDLDAMKIVVDPPEGLLECDYKS